MFFHCLTEDTARADFDLLAKFGTEQNPPCNVKLQLTCDSEGQYIIAMIYPAEYENEIGRWMIASDYRGKGPVDAGISQVEVFYASGYTAVESVQLAPVYPIPARSLEELLNTTACEIQRAM